MSWIRAEKKFNKSGLEGEFWNGEQKLTGYVEEVKKGTYNKYFMKIRTENNNLYITPQHHNLSSQIKRLNIQKQDKIRLKYLGEITTDNNNKMKKYLLEKWQD